MAGCFRSAMSVRFHAELAAADVGLERHIEPRSASAIALTKSREGRGVRRRRPHPCPPRATAGGTSRY